LRVGSLNPHIPVMLPNYLTWPEAVYLIATGDLDGIGEWPPDLQEFVAKYAISRRFPTLSDSLEAACPSRDAGVLWERVESILWSLLQADDVEWKARRSPTGPLEKGDPSELKWLKPLGVDAVRKFGGATQLFDLLVPSYALVRAWCEALPRLKQASTGHAIDRLHARWSKVLASARSAETSPAVEPSEREQHDAPGLALEKPCAPLSLIKKVIEDLGPGSEEQLLPAVQKALPHHKVPRARFREAKRKVYPRRVGRPKLSK
jgi:hypothetical protein